ncbi:MAG: ribosome biogenesis GTPase Der [Pseudomonadota bacterium]|nr:ribosome biogenesis GTPase Der [Pseudomonadota bacterium]
MTFTVAIIGRPNVGKSTLFNRLIGKRLAIVHNSPGVTRDCREGDASISDMKFTIIDTAGLDDSKDDSLQARMHRQTEQSLIEADVALFLIDARSGVTPLDKFFVSWMHKINTPTILIANKCEGGAGQSGLSEAFNLGLGSPIPLSAEHGEGLSELYDALTPFRNDKEKNLEINTWKEKPLQMAIVGRPNVGKSTMVNALLGHERMLTGPEMGITRDSISISWNFNNHAIRLIDTAGIRRKARIKEKLEGLSVGDTLQSIRFAEVVVLVLDAKYGLEKQDLTIARLVVKEGRALVIAANKWDSVKEEETVLDQIKNRLSTSLPQVKGVPFITCSSLKGRGLEKLLPTVIKIHKIWNRRIETGEINRWLEGMVESHPPPIIKGKRLKLRYITQVKSRPPTFIIFASQKNSIPDSYTRYLINGLRETFNLPAVPIRIFLRTSKNPYTPSN